jgi:hypothetical protein
MIMPCPPYVFQSFRNKQLGSATFRVHQYYNMIVLRIYISYLQKSKSQEHVVGSDVSDGTDIIVCLVIFGIVCKSALPK